MKLRQLFVLCAMALATTALAATATTDSKLPAFPGAEGYGRYTIGGRGGKVYTVTNLEDSGQGSLRWALSQPGPRTIVFNVDGTIHLQSPLGIPSNTTIAGQTAPGMGICVADFPFSLRGSNIIVRYMRIRLGNTNVQLDEADGWDGFGGYDSRDIIIDHCSVSWSIDECLSVYGNINTTVQWCIAAQSLVNSGHSKGAHGYGAIWGGSGASFHHNLLAHHTSRVPRLGGRPTTQRDERVDMRNNVFYNWGGEGSYGYEGMNVNIVNNYFKPGPGTTSSMSEQKIRRIAAIGIRTNKYVSESPSYAEMLHVWGKYYISGNNNSAYSDVNTKNWELGVYNQIDANGCDGTYTQATKDSIKLSQPIPFVHTTTHTAKEAYNHVVAYAGCCKGGVWDALDQQFIKDTKGGIATATGSGLGRGFINTQNDNIYIVDQFKSAWPTLTEGEKWTDTDGDGMPDEWETANGLNPNDPADGNKAGEGGYTNLEVYMNGLVADITAACTDGTVLGGEDVPVSFYDTHETGQETTTYYVIQNADTHVGSGKSITEVDGITATFSSEITDWKVGGSGSDAREVDGVPLTGKYSQSTNTNGAPVIFATTKPGTLTIFFGGDVATNKKVVMTDADDNGLTGALLSDGTEIVSNTNPPRTISAWDGIVYELQGGKEYTFKCTGTKWRMAAFRYVGGSTTSIGLPQTVADGADKVYNLHGQEVSVPQRGGIYIIGGRKVLIP